MSSDSAPKARGALPYGIAFGSNLGDQLALLSSAKASLLKLSDQREGAVFSPVYESQPVDCTGGSPPFLNAVAEIPLALEPAAVLEVCQRLEREAGRPGEREVNSPRPLDLDILYAGDLRCDRPELQIPHPRLSERLFVLGPLRSVRPDLVLPGFDQTVASLHDALDSDEPPLRPVAEDW